MVRLVWIWSSVRTRRREQTWGFWKDWKDWDVKSRGFFEFSSFSKIQPGLSCGTQNLPPLLYHVGTSTPTKESACNIGDLGSIPELGRNLGEQLPTGVGTATHSSILTWRIPWTLQSTGSQRVGHDWVTLTFKSRRGHSSPRAHLHKGTETPSHMESDNPSGAHEVVGILLTSSLAPVIV